MRPPQPAGVLVGPVACVAKRFPTGGPPGFDRSEELDLRAELEGTLGHLGCTGHAAALEGTQRWHYRALFALRFPLRHKAAEAVGVVASADIVRRHVVKLAQARVWRRVYSNVRLTVRARRKVLCWFWRCKEDRTATLEAWLKYWCACEDRPLRPRMSPRLAREKSLPAPTTDDDLKVYVLWDLYWLLHAQHCLDLQDYHNDLLQLRKQLADARLQDQPTAPILARLFVRFLQAPRFPREPGTDLRFADLLHLSAAQPTSPKSSRRTPRPLPLELGCCCPGHQTYAAFLSSPLCTRREWLQARHELPLTLIPPLRWIPASFADLHRCPSAVVPSLPSCHATQRASLVGVADVPHREGVSCLSLSPGSPLEHVLKWRLGVVAELDTTSPRDSPRMRRPPTVPSLHPIAHTPRSSLRLSPPPSSRLSTNSVGPPGPPIPLLPLALSSPRRIEPQSPRKPAARLSHHGKSFHALQPLGVREP